MRILIAETTKPIHLYISSRVNPTETNQGRKVYMILTLDNHTYIHTLLWRSECHSWTRKTIYAKTIMKYSMTRRSHGTVSAIISGWQKYRCEATVVQLNPPRHLKTVACWELFCVQGASCLCFTCYCNYTAVLLIFFTADQKEKNSRLQRPVAAYCFTYYFKNICNNIFFRVD